ITVLRLPESAGNQPEISIGKNGLRSPPVPPRNGSPSAPQHLVQRERDSNFGKCCGRCPWLIATRRAELRSGEAKAQVALARPAILSGYLLQLPPAAANRHELMMPVRPGGLIAAVLHSIGS